MLCAIACSAADGVIETLICTLDFVAMAFPLWKLGREDFLMVDYGECRSHDKQAAFAAETVGVEHARDLREGRYACCGQVFSRWMRAAGGDGASELYIDCLLSPYDPRPLFGTSWFTWAQSPGQFLEWFRAKLTCAAAAARPHNC